MSDKDKEETTTATSMIGDSPLAAHHSPLIIADGLSKTYRVYQKKEGLFGALRGLFSREYKDVKAVENVSFTIEPGEIVGFLGPNGAGKTTTLKMLAGLIFPTSGAAKVLGHIPW